MATKPENVRPNRKKKPKQGWIEGMEPPSIPEIDTAADDLAFIRSERMRFGKEEEQLAGALLLLMHKHKLKVYDYQGKRVEVEALEKIKVRKSKESNGEAEE